jgi:hypothetical protein
VESYRGGLLAEAPTIGGQFKLSLPSADKLQAAIYADLRRKYEANAKNMQGLLGGRKDFELRAAWKDRELQKQAKLMARSLHRTMQKERARIDQLPAAERRAAWEKTKAYKQEQLEALVNKEAAFQADTDMLVHSGIVNVAKARVMYFGGSPAPCPVCEQITWGNPYTIQQATSLGAVAHPGCRDVWEQEWDVDAAALENTRRQVRDGEVKLWNGRPQTPARGRAADKVELMQQAKGGWKGRATYQKRVATQRVGQIALARRRASGGL